jgi:hypothetical protein
MAITQIITVLPYPPSRSDPANFDTRADNFLGALPDMQIQMNTWAEQANVLASEAASVTGAAEAAQAAAEDAEAGAIAAQGTATTQAGIATTQAGIATTQAGTVTTQAGIATTQAGIATTQAGIATTKAGEAAASAALAADVVSGGLTSVTPAANKIPIADAFAKISNNWLDLTGYAPAAHIGATGAAHGAATTSVAGFMSGADKTKLDGVASGATTNTGTVTSVGLSLPTEFTVSDSPVTASGTLTATKASQAANQVYAAPNGSAGMPVFRALVAADIPALDQTYQPLDAELTALAGLSTAGLIERTGAGTAGIVTVTAAGKALLDDADAAAQRATLGLANLLSANAYFAKANPGAVAWTKTGNGTATTSQSLLVEVNGLVLAIAASTTITMPTLVAGTDYAIWCATDGSLSASSNHVTPPSTNARRIGGFHYAPGGNAAAQAGGDATPQINAYSFWDLKWRFAGADPRGMALVAGSFWADIYLTNTDPDTNGTSAYNRTIADGPSPPKIPTAFGGNGTTTYGGLTWFEVQELLSAYGKRAPTTAEFMALAYGVTEQTARGTDPGVTGLDQARTSRWGILQATGNLWVWGRELTGSGAANAAGWSSADTEARGDIYLPADFKLTAALLGALWTSGEYSGSRSADWRNAPSNSNGFIGARGVGDHLQLP